MQGIHIVATGKAVPARTVTNDDLSRTVDTSDEWIRTRTGIRQRHICEEETCVSLAADAAGEALLQAGIDKEQIGYVVVATTTPDYAFPSVACMVQKKLELSSEVMAFDISAACSGFLYGLNICRSLLMTGKKKYALLIGSEQMSRITDFTDRSTCVLFGDGAGAVLLEADDSLFVHRAWSDGNSEVLFCKGVGNPDAFIKMDGGQVFKFAVKVIKEGIDAVLLEAGLTMEDIDYVVCHQANERIIDHVSKKYGENKEKFFMNIAGYANTSAASIPIALDEMVKEQKLEKGMKIICVGFGAGFTWSSALLTI
ncbi:MAG: ketoacyl-ACP synthase III [Thermoflexaceae bacterium]|nr:ketoacyl-ACP synthase III [Thermoflexaceae bacterium]